MRRSIGLVLVMCVAACGGKSSGAAKIREASESDLTDCSFLQKVSGTASDTDGNAESTAKNAAREQAASIGATHVKWIVPCCTYVEAEAYRCELPVD